MVVGIRCADHATPTIRKSWLTTTDIENLRAAIRELQVSQQTVMVDIMGRPRRNESHSEGQPRKDGNRIELHSVRTGGDHPKLCGRRPVVCRHTDPRSPRGNEQED
jgi:hypothetical protein